MKKFSKILGISLVLIPSTLSNSFILERVNQLVSN